MAVIKIKQTALIIAITEQVSKAIATAIATQVEEVAALIALVALQVAHVLQEFHKPIAKNKKFIGKF
jgi:hypothetical protein